MRSVATAIGEVPVVETALGPAEWLGAWRMRWGMGRMRYRIEPGLYAVGRPDSASPVVVSANYRLSFDRLRSSLAGLGAWILVLETQGINVWCSAAKGTFGTDELIRRIEAARLPELLSHNKLIVPQLGAPGVAAHEVRKRSGFHVVYGPLRSEDLRAFLSADMKTTPEMRLVRFPLRDRVVLIPLELVQSAKYLLIAAACFFLLAGLGRDGYSLERMLTVGSASAVAIALAGFGSVVLAPILLPWLPGRAFAVKGLWLGLAMDLVIAGLYRLHPGLLGARLSWFAICLAVLAVASFLTMNFTGATPFTSLSGVRREMRIWVPVQLAAAALGAVLWLVARFV